MHYRRFSVLLFCLLAIGCGRKPDAHSSESKPSASPVDAALVTIKYEKSRASGTGHAFDEALQNALTIAVGQVNGTRVSKSAITQRVLDSYHAQSNSEGASSASGSLSAHANGSERGSGIDENGNAWHASESANAQLHEHAQANEDNSSNEQIAGDFDNSQQIISAASATSGAVSRYQVISSSNVKDTWTVTVLADVAVYQASRASRGLKVAVLPFRISEPGNASTEFESQLRSEIVNYLTQSGKVVVLDRDYTEEDQGELSQLQGDDFSKDQASKLGNKLGADYIIVGTVEKAKVTTESMYMPSVGKTIYGATHVDADVTYRVIEAATGVIQRSDTIRGKDFKSPSLSDLAEQESSALSAAILQSIFPLRIESVTDGVFYLGQGGNTVRVGDVFKVIQQGRPIVDSYTKEVIGHAEQELTRVVVTEVEPKMSMAKPIDGHRFDIADSHDLIARPVPAAGVDTTDHGGADAAGRATEPKKPPHKGADARSLLDQESGRY